MEPRRWYLSGWGFATFRKVGNMANEEPWNNPPQSSGAQPSQQPTYGQPQQPGQPVQMQPAGRAQKNKVAAGVLAILLGGLGIHKFYLGYSKEGGIMLAVWLVGLIFTLGIASGVMGVIGLVEGILYLTKSDEEF